MKFGIFCVLALFCFACNSSICNDNLESMDETIYTDESYKLELRNQIESGYDSTRYYVAGYKEQNGKKMLVLKLKGENYCGKAYFDVTNCDGVSGITINKGKGYFGAELAQVDLALDTVGQETNFRLLKVGRIID